MNSCSDVMVPRKTSRKDPMIKDPDDMISNLPDEVINLILSSLCTVEAVATCVLSKQWKYKWASMYNIEINDRKRPAPTAESGFIGFLERLTLHMRDVRRASLTLKHEYDSGGLEKFISDLLKRNNVEKLHIDTTQKLILPDSLFNSTSLKELVLIKGPFFNVHSDHCFVYLTSLCLRDLKISNQDAHYSDDLVFNFPVLENLEVSRCNWYGHQYFQIDINAPALKTFKSETRPNDDALEYYTINIHDARLEHLFVGGGEPENFCLTESQVVCATFECHISSIVWGAMVDSGEQIRSLLQDIAPTLEALHVSGDVAEAILKTRQGHTPLPRFNKLRTLNVHCTLLNNTGAVLFEILHATPFLECLEIDALFTEEYDYNAVDSVPWCIDNSLEDVCLFNIMEARGAFQLAEFLLKTAAKLKLFCVGCFCDEGCITPEEAKAIISGYSTASPDIKFHYF